MNTSCYVINRVTSAAAKTRLFLFFIFQNFDSVFIILGTDVFFGVRVNPCPNRSEDIFDVLHLVFLL